MIKSRLHADQFLRKLKKGVKSTKGIEKQKTMKIVSAKMENEVLDNLRRTRGSEGPFPRLKHNYPKRRRSINDPPLNTVGYRSAIKRGVKDSIAFVDTKHKAAKFHEHARGDRGKGIIPKRDILWLSDKTVNKLINFCKQRFFGKWR